MSGSVLGSAYSAKVPYTAMIQNEVSCVEI